MPAQSSTAPSSPVEHDVDAILLALTDAMERPDAAVSIGELLDILSQRSHTLVLLVLAVLNMIPGPPGYGGTLGWVIIAFSIAMIFGFKVRLPRFLGERKVPRKLLALLRQRLPQFARLVSRFTRARLQWLTGPSMDRPLGLLILIMALPMVVPIPFINAVPNVGMAVICVSRLNRDGLGVILGTIIGLAGMVLAGAAIWGALALTIAAIGMWGLG